MTRGWSRIVAVALFSVAPLGIVPAVAGDFAGTWRVQHVLLGDEVVLVLHLRVFNQGSTDVTEATVRVDEPVVPERQEHPSFSGLAIPAGESTDLRGDMVVTRAVYERWLSGGQPSVQIDFTDGAGNAVSQPIELVPEP